MLKILLSFFQKTQKLCYLLSLKKKNMPGGKDLKGLPVFTRREIELHVSKCGKRKGKAIVKTSTRGRLFKDERFLSSEHIYTAVNPRFFFAKAKCKASMKKVFRDVKVQLCKGKGTVLKASCSCPAGMSGYCNHVMALLYELAEYSLNNLTKVPHETACTSKLRKWGVPGNREISSEPVMKTTLISKDQKRGITPTLYDARLNFNQLDNLQPMMRMKARLFNCDKNTGYAHVIPTHPTFDKLSLTKYGLQFLGSPLSYQLPPINRSFSILYSIKNESTSKNMSEPFSDWNLYGEQINDLPDSLPIEFLASDFNMMEAANSAEKEILLRSLTLTKGQCEDLERRTRKQRECREWKQERQNRLTSTTAYKIFIRERNFNTLATQIKNPKSYNEQTESVKKALNHGINNEQIAKEKYTYIMNYRLIRKIYLRETGLIVQPKLYWLGASPDGIVYDYLSKPQVGLLEIKCPYSKRNSTLSSIVKDSSFYIGLADDGQAILEKEPPTWIFYTNSSCNGVVWNKMVRFCCIHL